MQKLNDVPEKKKKNQKRNVMNSAVSSESPIGFHVGFVKVLDKEGKNKEISQDHEGRFWNRLKRNSVFKKRTFHYSDIESQKFDYDKIGLGKGLDVSRGHSPISTPYSSKYQKFLDKGFGRLREMFTVEANQSRVKRINAKQIELFRNQSEKTKKKSYLQLAHKQKTTNSASKLFLVRYKPYNNCKYRKKTLSPNSINQLQDLDDFEKNLYKHIVKTIY